MKFSPPFLPFTAGLLFSGLLLVAPGSRAAAPDATANETRSTAVKTVRLLTIGNSFSRNATRFLGDLAKAGGHELVHGSIVVGGASLELHAGKIAAHTRDPHDKAGLYTNKRSLAEELRREPWNFVTIQQASIKSHDLATYQPFATQLRDFVRTHAPQAELLLHQTWAYRRDDPRFAAKAPKPGEPTTQEAMYRGLSAAYRTTAAKLGVRRIPVGDAFFLADTDPKWGFQPTDKFDPQSAVEPSLPEQPHSLHMGWYWKKRDGATKLVMDGHHASVAGEYLGACVFYEVIFAESCVGLGFVPRGIANDYAQFLRETAHRAVKESKAKNALLAWPPHELIAARDLADFALQLQLAR